MEVIKRNNSKEPFDVLKILRAATLAHLATENPLLESSELRDKLIDYITTNIEAYPYTIMGAIPIETIQDYVEKFLMQNDPAVAKNYIIYRERKKNERQFVENKKQFIENFIKSSNAANATIDDNSNVTNKNIATLNEEIHKPDTQNTNFYLWNQRIKKLYPEIPKNSLFDDLDTILYCHDSSSRVLTPYCMAVSMYPFLLEGLKPLGGLSAAPKNLDSYCGLLVNLIFALSSEVKGAVAVPEALLYFTHFAQKEWGNDFYKRTDTPITVNTNRPLTIKDQIHQYFQQITYTINQPVGRGSQSPFVNFSFFDKGFFKAMFENFKFPDDTQMEWEPFNYVQQEFLHWFNQERLKCVMTFPVCSYALLVDENNEFQDKETFDFVTSEYQQGNSFFTYISNTPDSLSSCCRLRNQINTKEFSFTNGNLGIMTGSKNVITLNLNRIIQDFTNMHQQYLIKTEAYYDELKKYLIEILSRVYKYQTAYNSLLMDADKAGLYNAYKSGFIDLKKQYLTIGINGLTAAAEFLNIETLPTPEYQKFCEVILGTIKEQNTLHKTSTETYNVEQVPAESAAIKLYIRDKAQKYWVPKNVNLYTSYMFKPYEHISILDKIKLHGEFVQDYFDGGMACHINLNEHLSKSQYEKILTYAAQHKCNYLTFNVPNSECNSCGFITKKPISKCPKCNSEDITMYDRVIGYLTAIKNWSAGRQTEQKLRIYGSSIE